MSIDTTPPNKNENFIRYWNIYLSGIEDRENLKQPHLQQLRILCDLSVEYDELQDIIEMEGMTYESHGRNGMQIKMRPEIAQKSKVITEIRNYSKHLGLVLYKDTKTTEDETVPEFGL